MAARGSAEIRARNAGVLERMHVRRPVPATARAVSDKWMSPFCDECEDTPAGVRACRNWVPNAGVVVEVLCAFRAAPSVFVYVEVARDATDEAFVRTVLARLSAPLAADLVKFSCREVSIATGLRFLRDPSDGQFYFNTELNEDAETRRWQAVLVAYLAEARPRTRALASVSGAGLDDGETRAVVAWFKAAGASAVIPCSPSKAALTPQPGPGCFRVYAFPGVPTEHHVTICTLGFATLWATATVRSRQAVGPDDRQELLVTVRVAPLPHPGKATPTLLLPPRVVDALYVTANELRQFLARECGTVAVGLVDWFSPQHLPAAGMPGFTFQTPTLLSAAGRGPVVRPPHRPPIHLVAMVPLTATETELVLRHDGRAEQEAAVRQLWQQFTATSVDVTDLTRASPQSGRKRGTRPDPESPPPRTRRR